MPVSCVPGATGAGGVIVGAATTGVFGMAGTRYSVVAGAGTALGITGVMTVGTSASARPSWRRPCWNGRHDRGRHRGRARPYLTSGLARHLADAGEFVLNRVRVHAEGGRRAGGRRVGRFGFRVVLLRHHAVAARRQAVDDLLAFGHAGLIAGIRRFLAVRKGDAVRIGERAGRQGFRAGFDRHAGLEQPAGLGTHREAFGHRTGLRCGCHGLRSSSRRVVTFAVAVAGTVPPSA